MWRSKPSLSHCLCDCNAIPQDFLRSSMPSSNATFGRKPSLTTSELYTLHPSKHFTPFAWQQPCPMIRLFAVFRVRSGMLAAVATSFVFAFSTPLGKIHEYTADAWWPFAKLMSGFIPWLYSPRTWEAKLINYRWEYAFSIQMIYIQVNARVGVLVNDTRLLRGFSSIREEVQYKHW